MQKSTFYNVVRFVLLVIGVFFLFYLIILPLIDAISPHEYGVARVSLGIFVLAFLFLVSVAMAVESTKAFYSIGAEKNRQVKIFLIKIKKLKDKSLGVDAPGALISMILSYIFFNYIFSVFYIFLSHVDNHSFSTDGPLSIIDGIFFSVVTATTIGYGDVYPETGIAKLSVLFQILISMFYAVVLFSASSSYLRDYVSTVKKQAAKEVAEELEQKTEQSAQG